MDARCPFSKCEREAMEARCPHLARQQTVSQHFKKCTPLCSRATSQPGEVGLSPFHCLFGTNVHGRIHGFALQIQTITKFFE